MSEAPSSLPFQEDLALVRAARSGVGDGWERLVRRIADPLWSACLRLCCDEADAREAFAAVVAALRAEDGYRLAAYDGSSRIETYVVLVARDVLAGRLLTLLSTEAKARSWAVFERFFEADILRLIGRRLPGSRREEERRDAYQDICLELVADDYRRLRAYGGMGSFGGFVLHTVDRLLIDIIRRTSPRRRLPAAIQRLDAFHQSVFRAAYWTGNTAGVLTGPDGTAALERVRQLLPPGYDGRSDGPARALSLDDVEGVALGDDLAPASPEAIALEREAEHLLSLAAGILRRAAESLSEAERLYLRIALGGGEPLPAREVARLMNRPVAEVYKLKQRVMARLRDLLEEDPAVKAWRASV